MKRQRSSAPRQYPRTARLNEVLREVLAEELERYDDDRLNLVTVTDVHVDGDLHHAVVWFDSLQGEDGDAEVLEALNEHRVRLQGAVARQVRMKRTPQLEFRADDVIRNAQRIETVLRDQPERPEQVLDPSVYEPSVYEEGSGDRPS